MARLPNGFPRRVLSAQAGYPEGRFQGAFDPAWGRGYRAGDQIVVPAGVVRKNVSNHGTVDGFFRWKVSLFCTTAEGAIPVDNIAYYLDVSVVGKNENDEIARPCQVQLGNAQVIYVPGRSIAVTVNNPTAIDLTLHWSLDEATPGISSWNQSVTTLLPATESDLDLPPFAVAFIVNSISGGTGFLLRGYDTAGNLAYRETVSSPRSDAINLSATLRYTIQPASGVATRASLVYQCFG